MTNQNLTDITIVLDRSGSMETIRDDTIGGFNSFLSDQRSIPGEATLTLVQFDHLYEVVHEGKRLPDVLFLNRDTYIPRGTTALLDAIGRTIDSTGKRLEKMKEQDGPGKVVFVIITDGLENASNQYSSNQVNEMIERQRNEYQWQFVFLGANQDAIATAAQLGILQAGAMTYTANAAGTGALYGSLSSNIRSFRVGSSTSVGFTDEDREKQKKASTSVY